MDSTQRRIGVIIPSYKSGESIRWTLDSIAAQRRRPDEVCVVFDGEDPVGEAIARDHAVVTEVIVREECSGGAAQPRNDGWNRIGRRVDYIHFLDSDDLISPSFYATLSQSLDANSGLVGVKVRSQAMLDEEIYKNEGFSGWDQLDELRSGEIEEVRLENSPETWLPFSFSLLRSESVASLEIDGGPWRGRRSEVSSGKQEYMEDTDFAFRLVASGRYGLVAGQGGIYVVRKGSVSDSMAKTYLWMWRAFELAIVPWAERQNDVRILRIAQKMRSMSVRKYARTERNFRIAMMVLLRDLMRRPRAKTVAAITLFLLGVDPQRKRSLSQTRSHRKTPSKLRKE